MNVHDVEYAALRRMQPAKKLEVLRALIRQAYELKAAGVRSCRPDLTESQVWEEARELVTRDRS